MPRRAPLPKIREMKHWYAIEALGGSHRRGAGLRSFRIYEIRARGQLGGIGNAPTQRSGEVGRFIATLQSEEG